MPGERLGDSASPVVKLIVAMEEFDRRFPGFERETDGIETDDEGKYWMRAVVETPMRLYPTRNVPPRPSASERSPM
jgi:arginine decarboxylase